MGLAREVRFLSTAPFLSNAIVFAMTTYIALLRAVNVGGTGKLPMEDLRALCAAAGFAKVRTFIASGNVVFSAESPSAQVKAALEARLQDYAGKKVGVFVRTRGGDGGGSGQQPICRLGRQPTYAFFLDAPPPRDAIDHVAGRKTSGSRLGSARFMSTTTRAWASPSSVFLPPSWNGAEHNTVAKLAELAAQL